MAFQPLNLTVSKRYLTAISNFNGVDYATQRFLASQDRAIDIKNFIYKDGVIQKRQGYEEIYKLTPTYYIPLNFDGNKKEEIEYKTNTVNFNGIWQFIAEDNQLHVIAHVGKLLYEIKNYNNENISFEPISNLDIKESEIHNSYNYFYLFEFEDYKSNAFVGGNRLYFLGGNKYMCLRFVKNAFNEIETQFYAIENHEKTYIPTTTISITYTNSSSANRSGLDNVNLLNKWRKNELISGTIKNEDDKSQTDFFEYLLDSPLVYEKETDMDDFLIILENRGTIE